MGLRRENILKGRDLRLLFKGERKRVDGGEMVLYYLEGQSTVKVGVVVPKRIGRAVLRNKLKRILKNFMASIISELKEGYYFFLVKEHKEETDFKSLILHLLLKGKLLKNG